MKVAIAVLVVLVARTAHATPEEPPSPSAGELLGGLALGSVLGIGSGLIAGALADKHRCELDREGDYDAFEGPCFRRVAYAFTIGGSLGLGFGMYAVGRLVGSHPSILTTTGGAVIGALGGAVLGEFVIIDDRGSENVRRLGVGMLVALTAPMVGVIVGTHFGRRGRISTNPGLVRFDAGRLQLGVPTVARDGSTPMLSLAGGTF